MNKFILLGLGTVGVFAQSFSQTLERTTVTFHDLKERGTVTLPANKHAITLMLINGELEIGHIEYSADDLVSLHNSYKSQVDQRSYLEPKMSGTNVLVEATTNIHDNGNYLKADQAVKLRCTQKITIEDSLYEGTSVELHGKSYAIKNLCLVGASSLTIQSPTGERSITITFPDQSDSPRLVTGTFDIEKGTGNDQLYVFGAKGVTIESRPPKEG